MSVVWTSIVSLVFGLAAWTFPVVALFRHEKHPDAGTAGIFSAASLGACSVSLCAQLYHVLIRVRVQDWAGLMDTIQSVALAGTFLLAVTIALNASALIKYRQNKP